MEGRWTPEEAAVWEDLTGLARLAALAPITPMDQSVIGPAQVEPGEEDIPDQWIDGDRWRDEDTLPLFGAVPEEAVPVCGGVVGVCQSSWPALKAWVLGLLRTWPKGAPLLPQTP